MGGVLLLVRLPVPPRYVVSLLFSALCKAELSTAVAATTTCYFNYLFFITWKGVVFHRKLTGGGCCVSPEDLAEGVLCFTGRNCEESHKPVEKAT